MNKYLFSGLSLSLSDSLSGAPVYMLGVLEATSDFLIISLNISLLFSFLEDGLN